MGIKLVYKFSKILHANRSKTPLLGNQPVSILLRYQAHFYAD